jgi:hypothetical protein
MGSEKLITLTGTTVPAEERVGEPKINVATAVEDNNEGVSVTELNTTNLPFYDLLFSAGQMTLETTAAISLAHSEAVSNAGPFQATLEAGAPGLTNASSQANLENPRTRFCRRNL